MVLFRWGHRRNKILYKLNIKIMTSNTQKLIDIAFEIALTMKQNIDWVEKSSHEEIAKWVSKQLSQCGYQTIPLGASHGILKKDSK